MRVEIRMQRFSPDLDDAVISRWLKGVGDTVRPGESIVEVETDKVTVEMEALDGGRLVEVFRGDGAEVVVGDVIGWLER